MSGALKARRPSAKRVDPAVPAARDDGTVAPYVPVDGKVYRRARIQYELLEVDDLNRTFSRREMRDAESVACALRELYGSRTTEHMGVIALAATNRPIGHCIVGQGTETSTHVSPAEVLRFLLLTGAVACVLFHNHPSGNRAPSADDVNMTENLVEACRIIGVKCLDHVILTAQSHTSLFETQPELFLPQT